MRISVVKVGNTLAPVDDEGLAALAKISQGEVFTVEIQRDRRGPEHRLYWHLCGLVAENMDTPISKEEVSSKFKVATGRVDPDTGKPLSLSFESMEQSNFDSYWSAVLDIVAGMWDTTPVEVLKILDGETGLNQPMREEAPY